MAQRAKGGGGRAEERKGRAPPGPRSLRARLGALRNLWPFLVLVWGVSPRLTLISLALRFVSALQPVSLLFVGKLIIDDVIRLTQLSDKPETLSAWLESGLLAPLALLVAAELALAILSDTLWRVRSLVDDLLGQRASDVLSLKLMEHAATVDLADFEDADFQNRLDRARRQTGSPLSVMWTLFRQAQDLVTGASLAAGLILYAPWLMALLALSLVPTFISESHFNMRRYFIDFHRTQEERERNYVRYTAASVETAKEVKIFGLAGFLVERYRRLAAELYAARRKLAVEHASWGGLFEAIGTIGYYAAYALIVWRTVNGELTIGDLTFLAGSFQRLHSLIQGLFWSFSSMAGEMLYLDDLVSFFDVSPRITSAPGAKPFPDPIREGFVFEGVGFKYPGKDAWAVRGLDFTLRAGEVLALVGENGAGKTTLVKLLTRLYDPSEGRILLDGVDLRDYGLENIRSNVGVIFQDFVRYSFTAADNIAAGRIEARDDRARIERAAARSQADAVVARLPAGYAQMVGKRFEGGVELSGGEWQKIAIARAYMREPAVLILDEPTAALDARAEYQVFRRFKELIAGRTAVLISHRFSSVRMADRILVLADGRVEAQGTHAELIARPGRYAELFELQAAGYR